MIGKTMRILNISGYKFIALNELPQLQQNLLAFGRQLGIKGTVLLAPEGINIMLAATEDVIASFLAFLKQDPRFTDLTFKESFSEQVPFIKLKVKIKQEIITLKDPSANPLEFKGQYVSPEQFKRWLDEGQDIAVLDTRNHYEIAMGTFTNAIDLEIDHFRQFPEAIQSLDDSLKEKPVVMFCTGGVRCEKAAMVLEHQGFKKVYQLHGGILEYFAECGGAYYQGDCFVFDDRVALTPELRPFAPE